MKRLARLASRDRPIDVPTLVYLGSAALGALCLLAGLRFPWFPLPSPATQHQVDSMPVMSGIDAPCTRGWKISLALFLIICAVAAWKRPRNRASIICLGFSICLAALLFYPCSLLYFAPTEAARASWLHAQHRNLTWLGGDVFGSSEIKNQGWKFHVTIVDLPRQTGAVKIPKSIPYLLNIGRLGETAEWLGYSEAFCSLSGRGWLMAVGGSFLLLVSATRWGERLDYQRVRLAVKGFAGAAGALGITALFPVFFAGFAVSRGHEAIQTGDYAASSAWLNLAGRAMPVIREDSYLIIQHGLIDERLRKDTLEAAHYRAICLENNRFYSQAEESFRGLLDRAPANSAVQRELLRGLLRCAIRSLNSDQWAHGTVLLEQILRYDPINLKANQCLQIAYLRSNRLADLEATFTAMRQIYRFIGAITKIPVLASCQENEAIVRFLNGDLEGTLADRRNTP